MYIKLNLNISAARQLPDDNPLKRHEARSEIKPFLLVGIGGMVDSLVPDHLVTDKMIDRFLRISPPMCRLNAEFDPIIQEIEQAYVLGHVFSSVASSVVAIERMLNDARMKLHDHCNTPKRKELWGKGPINDWKPNIDSLLKWGYIKSDLAQELRDVFGIRCRYLHSGPIGTLDGDSIRSVTTAFDTLTEFIGFPARLFEITDRVKCLDTSHPLYEVFYKPAMTMQFERPEDR